MANQGKTTRNTQTPAQPKKITQTNKKKQHSTRKRAHSLAHILNRLASRRNFINIPI